MAGAGRPSPEGPPRSAPSGRGWPAVVLGSGRALGLGGTAERLARPARRRAAGLRRSDSMRDILARTPGNGTCATACATPRSPLRQRRNVCGGFPGRQRRIFPSGAPAATNSGRFPFLAWPSRGGALGHEGTSPALAMSGALPVTPRVTACTGPVVEDRLTARMLMLRVVETVSADQLLLTSRPAHHSRRVTGEVGASAALPLLPAGL